MESKKRLLLSLLLLIQLKSSIQRSYDVGNSPVQRKSYRPPLPQNYYANEEDELQHELFPEDPRPFTEDPSTIDGPQSVKDFDLADKYISTPSLMLVSVSTALSGFAILSLLCAMLLSFIPSWLTFIFALAMSGSVFTTSHLGVFSKALGVVSIELILRANAVRFIGDVNRYVSAALNMKERKAYPPGDNPWKYEAPEVSPQDNDDDVPVPLEFNQYSTMAAAIAMGTISGWSVAKPIPLLPSWLIGLSAGVAAGYISTMKDARGDLVRFVGNSFVQSVEETRALAQDVKLGFKFSHVSSQTSEVLKRIDEKYRVVERAKGMVTAAVSFFTMAVNRVKSDIDDIGEVGEERRGDGEGGGPDVAQEPFSGRGTRSDGDWARGSKKRRRF